MMSIRSLLLYYPFVLGGYCCGTRAFAGIFVLPSASSWKKRSSTKSAVCGDNHDVWDHDAVELKQLTLRGLNERTETSNWIVDSNKNQISSRFTDDYFDNLVQLFQKNMDIQTFVKTIQDEEQTLEFPTGSTPQAAGGESSYPPTSQSNLFADPAQVIDLISTCKLDQIESIRLYDNYGTMIIIDKDNLESSKDQAKDIPWGGNEEEFSFFSIIFKECGLDSFAISTRTTRANAEAKLRKAGLLKESLDFARRIKKQVDSSRDSVIGNESDDLVIPREQFVLTEPSETSGIWINSLQTDKQAVVVITGESGSGKTVYSCLAPKEYIPSTTVLYAALGAFDARQDTQIIERYKNILRHMLKELEENNFTDTLAYTLVSEVFTCVSANRNKSAFKYAQSAWRRALQGNNETKEWFDNPSVRLKHLTLVIDKVSNLDFANDIIDAGRDIIALYQKEHAQTVRLILVGTGLDRLDPRTKTMGTNAPKAVTIIMKKPNLEGLEWWLARDTAFSQEIFKAIKRGGLSRRLATNSRMFFHGIWRIMNDEKHFEQPTIYTTILEERLTDLGSILNVMDYCLREFIIANPIGQEDEKTRTNLLADCFLFHWKESMKELNNENQPDICEELIKSFCPCPVDPPNLIPSERIFELGLARKDSSATSAALKLLSCNMRSAVFRTADGVSLEDITALHLVSWFKAVLGIKTYYGGGLKQAWPPATRVTKKNLSERKIKTLIDEKDLDEEELLIQIKEIYENSNDRHFCIIFRRTYPNAQGPNIFALEVQKEENARLHCFHCKNQKNTIDEHGKVQKGDRNWKGCWIPLGVDVATKDIEPKNGTAGYSYAGIKKLAHVIEKKLGTSVVIGTRAIVCSMPRGEMTKSHLEFARDTEQCAIFWREALEPTISALFDEKDVLGVEV